jgi:hypothetical protein
MKMQQYNDELYSLGVKEHPGYHGVFTTEQYPGALPNGTRITKVMSEVKDSTPNGSLGTVLGSIGHPDLAPRMMYFIEWDHMPKVAIGCLDFKVQKVEQ